MVDLGDDGDLLDQVALGLEPLAGSTQGNPTIAGACAGLLHGDGHWSSNRMAARLAGWLSGSGEPDDGARFLRGVLATDRSCLWQNQDIIEKLHETLAQIDEEHFLAMVPHLRLGFTSLTPSETDKVAKSVATLAGKPGWRPPRLQGVTSSDAFMGDRLNTLVTEQLANDGLEAFIHDRT